MKENQGSLSPADLTKKNDYWKFSKQKGNNKQRNLGVSGRVKECGRQAYG